MRNAGWQQQLRESNRAWNAFPLKCRIIPAVNRRFWVLSLLIAISCTTATAPQREPVDVVFVGTTEVHGWFNGHVAVPPRGGEGIRYGGSATFMSYLSALRAANP